MSETAKKALLVVLTLVALAVAGFGAKKLFSEEQGVTTQRITLPPGTKSMKQMEKEAQAQGAPPKDSARDLSGDLPGMPGTAGGAGK